MSKKIKIGISILLLIIMISVHVSYAISDQTEKGFFKVNKEEISPEETLEMTFDISSLKYNKFKILLKSNVDSEDIYTENGENISIDNDENAISIDVNKEKISLNQIKLYYPIPKEMAIGTKIGFTAQIIVNNEIKEENQITNNIRDNTVTNELEIDDNTQSLENEIKQDNNTKNLENEIKRNNNTREEVIAEEITKTVTVIEKKIEDNKNNENKEQNEEKNKNPNENNNEQNSESKIPNTEKNNYNQEKTNNQSEKMSSSNMSNQKMSSNSNIGSGLSNSGINNENRATYNGSNNNYLSKLEIDGMELNTSFNKENETYFINTDNTNTINVILAAEDSKAKINIAGNDTIQKGNNKILISVTAENGDVRYYRIFVNCEEGTDET